MYSRISNLRAKIAARTKELGIEPAHDSTGHWYRYQNQLYPSVTSKLSILKDQGLMNWKMNRALEYLENYLGTDLRRGTIVDESNFQTAIRQAKIAPQLEFEGAGDIGKAVHRWREMWFDAWIYFRVNKMEPVLTNDPRPEVIASCKAIENCITKLQAQPLACELYLADEKLKLGGTLDDIWAVPHTELINTNDENLPEPLKRGKKIKTTWEVWLVDLKTSNIGNKNSYYMQVATYWAMFRKLYKIKIDKVFILHTSKTRFGDYELIPLKYPKRYFQMAKSTYKLYDDLEELEELKKPEIAKI